MKLHHFVMISLALLLACTPPAEQQEDQRSAATGSGTGEGSDPSGGAEAGAADGDGTTGETTGGDTTAGDTTAGDTTAGDTTAGDTTAGDTTGGDTTAGDTTGGETTGDDTTDDTVQVGNVALGFPEDLVVVSPYTSESAALAAEANAEIATIKAGNVAVATLWLGENPPPFAQSERKGFATKRAFLTALLRNVDTEDGCVFQPEPPNARELACYGPELKYANHPDWPGPGPGPGKDGTLPKGDLGFWIADEPLAGGGQEACMAAKTNEVIEEISNRVDNATGTAAMLLCFARKDGKRLPEVGQTLDLMPYAATANGKGVLATFQTAAIQRLADVGGNPVYQTDLSFVTPAPLSHAIDLQIKHKPTAENNASYSGVLKMTVGAASPQDPYKDCSQPDRPMIAKNGFHAVSIAYKKTDETDLSYEFRSGKFPYDYGKANLFDGDNAKLPANGGCNLGGELALYKTNPTTGDTKLSYSWIAGTAVEEARTLVTELTVDGTAKEGCGYFGFGAPMEDILVERAGKVDGAPLESVLTQFFCNWAGPGAMPRTSHEKVQKQCATQNPTTGVYAKDGLGNIFFSPQNTCQRNNAINPPFSFCTSGPACSPTNPTTTMHSLLDISGAFDKSVLYSPPVFSP